MCFRITICIIFNIVWFANNNNNNKTLQRLHL